MTMTTMRSHTMRIMMRSKVLGQQGRSILDPLQGQAVGRQQVVVVRQRPLGDGGTTTMMTMTKMKMRMNHSTRHPR
jgi:hypothetical protein